MADLLPPNATPLEQSLGEAGARLSEIPVPVGDLWSPERCPLALLPWLAWALSVDEWEESWPEGRKREAIAASAELHRHKGTVWSVREALRRAGYHEVRIDEGPLQLIHDGQARYSGGDTYGGATHWARYDLRLDLGETAGVNPAAARLMRQIAERFAPASRHLRSVAHEASMSERVEASETVGMSGLMSQGDRFPGGPVHDGSLLFDGASMYGERGDRLDLSVTSGGIPVQEVL